MYIIINRTSNTKTVVTGNWPDLLLTGLVHSGSDIIVISTYSNTIKVPRRTELNGEVEYEWVDYELPVRLLRKSFFK